MSKERAIREYVDDYVKYYPEKWRWQLKNDLDQHELYMNTRARRSKDYYQNCDLLPDFYSIERDADQFELCKVEFTDIFGLVWEGEKGVHAYAGAPNYQGNLYYYDPDEEYDSEYSVSYEYDAYNKQPPEEIYTKIGHRGVYRWIDTANVVNVRYKYIVNNHLFKDTYIELIYEDEEVNIVFSDYSELINGFLRQGKRSMVDKILKTMNEHFIKLRDSDREEIQKFYPGKTAEEMFLKDNDLGKTV